MERSEFINRFQSVIADGVLTDEELKKSVKKNARSIDEDLPICIGELAELALELTRFQRGKMDMNDLIQELSHVQWVVWRVQDIFSVDDIVLRASVQASFR